MPLTKDEYEACRKAAEKSRNGDPGSIQFFESLKAQNTARAREFLECLEEYNAEHGGGLQIDMTLVQTLGLSAQQVKDCKAVTMRYKNGDKAAIAFFNGCAVGERAGSMPSGAMITLRDAILESMAKAEAAELTASTQKPLAQAPVTVTAVQSAPVAAAQPRALSSVSGGAVKVSSNMVVSVPRPDAEGLELIQGAIDEQRFFAPEAVQPLVHAIRDLLAHQAEIGKRLSVTPAEDGLSPSNGAAHA